MTIYLGLILVIEVTLVRNKLSTTIAVSHLLVVELVEQTLVLPQLLQLLKRSNLRADFTKTSRPIVTIDQHFCLV
jgi:hypothetical protein